MKNASPVYLALAALFLTSCASLTGQTEGDFYYEANNETVSAPPPPPVRQQPVRIAQEPPAPPPVPPEKRAEAQTALTRGIAAQGRGSVIEALSCYYEAAALDPTLTEPRRRSAAIFAEMQSRNSGQDLQSDLRRRDEWLKFLKEAAAFFQEHPPYELVYETALRQGKVDYNKRTVEISFHLHMNGTSGFQLIADIKAELIKAARGKVRDWGLEGWPGGGEAAVFSNWIKKYSVTAVLTNANGKPIGAARALFDRSYSLSVFSSGLKNYTGDKKIDSMDGAGALAFKEVKAGDITENLTVSIVRVNGMDAKTAQEKGYMRISATDQNSHLNKIGMLLINY